MRSLSPAIPVRQSTSVPKTSKKRALTESLMQRSCASADSSQALGESPRLALARWVGARRRRLFRAGRSGGDVLQGRFHCLDPEVVSSLPDLGPLSVLDLLDVVLEPRRERRIA